MALDGLQITIGGTTVLGAAAALWRYVTARKKEPEPEPVTVPAEPTAAALSAGLIMLRAGVQRIEIATAGIPAIIERVDRLEVQQQVQHRAQVRTDLDIADVRREHEELTDRVDRLERR